jgi:integrase
LTVLNNLLSNFPQSNQLKGEGMLAKITKAAVDRMQPGALLWDTSLVGFGARLQLRHVHYIVRYRFGGKQKLLTIGKHGPFTPETARREAQRLLGVVASGVDPAAKAAEGDSFSAVMERYLERKSTVLRPRTFVEVERHLRKHSAALHKLALDQISRRDVAEVLAKVEVGSGSIARNRVRASLSAFWSWAITEGLVENSPVQATAKASEGNGRERVLNESETCAVWSACGDDDFGKIVKLLLLTGQRKNEIAQLRWSEICLADATITFPPERTKNGRQHTLPLSRQALALLTSIPHDGDAVFRQVHWTNAKERLALELPHWTLHDLRRTAVTWMNELGTAPHIVEAVVNHVSGNKAGIAGRYNRARYETEMRAALQKWADHIEALIVWPRKQPVPGLIERAFAVARGGKIVPNEDLANLARQLRGGPTTSTKH